ncbi:hypothetical protein L486_02097 [Kwoniella mangroviensis CBS 10435]|uniref:6-phosphogluconolactonase n=1 Tax=Kwoniella mangroviensis CBS 10435 TaxID=1331196 RepID=A0A1B9IV63_9TREE|nr:uncharacterized protein I203_04738 [Kwoniella mangroviensis CBS 8507]OCF59432.1 hypothetical protein L486_02097 [Kwoniella mangroviensis CBS 10435]OCF66405.1 hypothetical protein I203_04738 [Kwoniella mangroviensis CBS 8507]
MSDSEKLILLGTHATSIHSAIFDPKARTLKRGVSTNDLPAQPSWLIKHPKHSDLIFSNGWVDNKLIIYRLKSSDGKLEKVAEANTGGEGPTHFAILPDGSEIAVAHYRSGSVTVLPLGDDGLFAAASPTQDRIYKGNYSPKKHWRQEAAHMHQVVLLNGEILIPDLGSNKVYRFKWDSETKNLNLLDEIQDGFQDGDGPRHLVVHPSGSHLYVLNEVAGALTVHTLPASGPSKLVKRYTMLPPNDDGRRRETGGAEIVLLPPTKPDGRMLLIASNRDSPNDEDTLALFSVSQTDGGDVIRTNEGWLGGVGKHLRAVEQDPSGRYVLVAARDTGRIVVFERSGENGLQLSEVARLEGVESVVVPLWI